MTNPIALVPRIAAARRRTRAHAFTAGETIYAVCAPSRSLSRAAFVIHVWSRDGVEVARHYLPLAAAGRARRPVWSRHRLETGAYAVEVLGADGRRLGQARFAVAVATKP